ncbi:MAG: hypothetical protein JOY96_02010 [Verrucomicrobia bacterium]|nr:hypothetical protein [Verrucomicrobiota bacterium]
MTSARHLPTLCLSLLGVLLVGCSTIESRIKANPQALAVLSPADQALVRQGRIREGFSRSTVYLAWGPPDRVRYGSRAGRPFEAWIYTRVQSSVLPSSFPTFYRFGPYRYSGYWPYNRFYGFYPYPYDPFLDDIITYEVPFKVAFFEGDRCTGWEYIR